MVGIYDERECVRVFGLCLVPSDNEPPTRAGEYSFQFPAQANVVSDMDI